MKEKIQHNAEVSINELLVNYTQWLVVKGYTDTDPIYEEPLAVDEYLKENPPANFLKEYADWKIKECLPERMDANDMYSEGWEWNQCLDAIELNLSNKDKIK